MTNQPRSLSDLRPHTVNIDDELWLDAAKLAQQQGRSISQIINDAMRQYLHEPRREPGDY